MAPVLFDGQVFERIVGQLLDGHITYRLGAKCTPGSAAEPQDIRALDCSGLVEYLFYQISQPHTDIPSGSSNQEDWFEARYPRVPYSQASRLDGFLRIAFRDRRRRMIRHVWFILNGRTIESTTKGDNDGPTSLHWSDRCAEADDCFLLGLMLPLRF